MPTARPSLRPLSSWKHILSQCRSRGRQQRCLATAAVIPSYLRGLPPPTPWTPKKPHHLPRIKTIAPPPSASKQCKDPIAAITSSQLAVLDPTGARTRLFAQDNPDGAKVGDIILVRLRSGDPFAGVLLSIKQRGVDTGILLRAQLTRVGVEMWYKIYSPNVEGVEIVQRRRKRTRRARLYYMRKPKHDIGSVEKLVLQYERRKRDMGMSGARGRAGKMAMMGQKGKKKGKK